MKRNNVPIFRLLPACFAILLGPSFAVGQSPGDTLLVSISARVVNAVTQSGVPGAVLRIQDLEIAAVSDSVGYLEIAAIPAGVYRITVARAGFRSAGDDVLIEQNGSLLFHLTPETSVVGGTGQVRGQVRSKDTGMPISSAMVSLPGMGVGHLSNDDGWFLFQSVPAGDHVFKVEHIGYEPVEGRVTLKQGELADIVAELSADPIELPGITVTARPGWLTRTGFLRRQESSAAYSGRQWTREEIEARNPVFVQDILTTATGIQLRSDRAGKSVLYGRRRCKLSVYVDDVLVPDFNLEALDPDWIEALEVYHGSSSHMPAEYGMKHCGVVLIWLRR